MGIGQLLTMPLFFASNAIYPLAMMPPWLHAVPGSTRSATRSTSCAVMIPGGESVFGLGLDFAVLTGI